jgi:subtilisin family serine protease
VTEEHPNSPAEDLQIEEAKDMPTNLDPHLQQVIQAVEADLPVDRSVLAESETGEIEVDVLAKLKNPDQEVPQLKVVQTIGQIVTVTVAVANIEEVRNHPNVISLKRATRLQPELMFSVPEIRADATQLHAGLPAGTHIDGSGVIVAIIDFGCDFLHDNLRNVDGTTRLLFLWDQRAELTASSPAGYPYGREYDAAAIDAALVKASAPPPATDPIYQEVKFPEDPKNQAYLALGYAPDPTPINSLRTGQHGTHVMDIAAGNGRGSAEPGVAPGADLIFVHVAAEDYKDTESFGNSRRLLEAIKYVFDKASALGRQCVVNFSLGTHGGPHDGSTLVEEGFDTLLETPGRAIVISAGNSFLRASHASGQVAASTPRRSLGISVAQMIRLQTRWRYGTQETANWGCRWSRRAARRSAESLWGRPTISYPAIRCWGSSCTADTTRTTVTTRSTSCSKTSCRWVTGSWNCPPQEPTLCRSTVGSSATTRANRSSAQPTTTPPTHWGLSHAAPTQSLSAPTMHETQPARFPDSALRGPQGTARRSRK